MYCTVLDRGAWPCKVPFGLDLVFVGHAALEGEMEMAKWKKKGEKEKIQVEKLAWLEPVLPSFPTELGLRLFPVVAVFCLLLLPSTI